MMTKTKNHRALFTRTALAVLCAILFFSCDTPFWELDGMFSEIEKEIKLEDGVVKGNIYSLIEYRGLLIAGGGLIYYKYPSEVRGWHEFPKPGNKNDRVIRLAAGHDGSTEYLYALTAHSDESGNTTYKVFSYNSSWSSSIWSKTTSSTTTPITIFGNNAVSNGGSATNNNAYINKGDGEGVFNLENGSVGSATTSANGLTAKTVAAAYISPTDYFSDSAAFCSDGSTLYEGSGSGIKSGTSMPVTGSFPSVSGTIRSMWATAGYVYVGTNAGAVQIRISNKGSEKLPGSNPDATIGSYYISCIFANAGDTSIYAATIGTTTFQGSKNNCLWGYYASRGNWNKE